MKKSELWEVRKVHSKEAYNDTDNYAIYNATNVLIAKTDDEWNLLNKIVIQHNKCFVEQEATQDEANL
jgi:hypothetical protein